MKIYDLSQPFTKDMGLYPGGEAPVIENIYTVKKDGFNMVRLDFTNHSGTHLDCPGHMIEDGKWIHELSLDHFIGSGVVIDCKGTSQISKEMLVGKVDNLDAVLFYSGWEHFFYDERITTSYPVLTKEACEYLIEKNIKIVGVDYLSVDPVFAEAFDVHKTLLGSGMILYENLCNLEQLIGKTFEFQGFPLPVEADGIPVRALAIIR